MEKIKFGRLFDFQKKTNLKASEEDIDGKFPFYTSSSVISKRTNSPIYDKISLIIGNGGSANIHYADVPFSATSHCYIAVANTSDVNTKFVYYYLSSNLHILERGFKGAGLKNISSKYVEEIEIPLPDLETQNKIVAILDKAKAISDKREKTIKMYDELLRATFLEMFGDPVKNENGWETRPFNKVGNFVSGGTPDKSNIDFWTGNFPWVSPKDMKVPVITDSQDHISEIVFDRTSIKRLEPNHLLIVVRGMILAHSFPTAINSVSVTINQDMKAVMPYNDVNVVFLKECLDVMRPHILSLVSTAGHGTKKFDSDAMGKLKIPIPPIELQNIFFSRIRQIVSLREKSKEFQRQISDLLASLSQQAFKGKLDFNTAVDLEVLLENDYQFFKENSNSGSIKLLLKRLNTDELNESRFYEQQTYDKAKNFVFELIKEGKVKQVFDEKAKKVKLTV